MLAGQPDGMSAPQAATTQIRQGQEAGAGSRSWEQEQGAESTEQEQKQALAFGQGLWWPVILP